MRCCAACLRAIVPPESAIWAEGKSWHTGHVPEPESEAHAMAPEPESEAHAMA